MMGDALHYCLDARAVVPLTPTAVRHYLEVIPQRIGMSVIAGPHVVGTTVGWQGYVIIAESHISVETRGLDVYTDIFSCKPFKPGEVLQLTCDLLGLDIIATKGQLIRRGWARRVV